MDLQSPALILLVAPAVLLTLAAAKRSAVGLAPARAVLSMTARCLLLLALGLILAGARAVLPHEERAVVFALDASESISPATRQRLLQWTRDAWAARRPGDRAALVVFGSRARVEVPLGEAYEPGELNLDGLPRDRTALDRALRTAAGLLRREEAERRVVLLSDGNGDAERAVREAMALASSGVEVTTVAVELTPSPREVLVGDVSAPPIVSEGEPFLLKVEVVARTGGPAKVHVEANGEHLSTHEVELAPGSNQVAIAQRLARAATHLYRVSVEAPGDGDPANNAGGAFVRVRGRPRALFVQGPVRGPGGRVVATHHEVAGPLARALGAAGFDVKVAGPDELPLGLEELAGYDVLVLGDVPAERWSDEQMQAVRAWVSEQGGGLLALGGEQAFGLGGYYRTPIEEALPVSCSLRGKKVLPSMALVLCMDTSGSMREPVGAGTKLDLAKEGAVRTLELLQPFDRLGVLGFSDEHEWHVLLTAPLDDPGPIAARIRGMDAVGGTEIGPALVEALDALRAVPAQIKHVVLLTDGKSQGADWARITADYRREHVTLSTVGVGAEVDRRLLAELAGATGGRFIDAADARTVPRLLSKEAVTATKALLIEREVVPRVVGELGADVDWAGMPALRGYVMTQAKPEAEVLLDTGPEDEAEDGPILVRWRYGLGKSAAFTSDAAARWSSNWLGWPGFGQVLAAVTGWVARDPQPPGFETTLQVEQGEGRVRVRARTADGSPIHALSLEARVTGPAGAAPIEPLRLEQTAPGTYEATFVASRPGAYFVQVAHEAAAGEAPRAAGSAGAVLAYPREYRDLTSDTALLARLARITRGEALTLDDPPARVFAGPRVGRRSHRPLAPFLFVAAGVFLLLDVAARRLVVPEALKRLLRRRRPDEVDASAGAAPQLLAALKAHKAAGREAARRGASGRVGARAPASDRVAVAEAPAPATASPASAPTSPPPTPPPVVIRKPPAPKPPPPRPPASPDDGSAMSKLLRAKREARGGRS